MREARPVIALDFPSFEAVKQFLALFPAGESLYLKVGMELYYATGPEMISYLKGSGHSVFLDLKLHDIPNTVYSAAKGLAKFNIDILTVHAAGGSEMLKGAKRAMTEAGVNTKVIAITQLTSTSEEDMRKEQNIQTSIEESVLNYARLAKESGIDGVVSSVLETKKIREQSGEDFIIINPGILIQKYKISEKLFGFSATSYGAGSVFAGIFIFYNNKFKFLKKLKNDTNRYY